MPVFSGKKCAKSYILECEFHVVRLLDPVTLGIVPTVEMGIVCLDRL